MTKTVHILDVESELIVERCLKAALGNIADGVIAADPDGR